MSTKKLKKLGLEEGLRTNPCRDVIKTGENPTSRHGFVRRPSFSNPPKTLRYKTPTSVSPKFIGGPERLAKPLKSTVIPRPYI